MNINLNEPFFQGRDAPPQLGDDHANGEEDDEDEEKLQFIHSGSRLNGEGLQILRRFR